MSARRWPTGRYTFRQAYRTRPWWRDALYVALWALLAVLVLGWLVPLGWR